MSELKPNVEYELVSAEYVPPLNATLGLPDPWPEIAKDQWSIGVQEIDGDRQPQQKG